MSDLHISGVLANPSSQDVSRTVLFSTLIGIGFANGIVENLPVASFEGLLVAVLNTFETSVFVWIALAAGLILVWRSPPTPMRRIDWACAIVAGLAMLTPVPALSWLALSGLALFLMLRSARGSPLRRGATILLALTIPTFWARIAMSLFNDVILAVDATLTAFVVGSQRDGNIVPFADGSGAMWIAPTCSSFTNLSLAILVFVGLVNATTGVWSRAKLSLALLTGALVVLINVIRISLIGYFPSHFELIHGQVGASIANWLTTLVIVAMGWLAVRRDAINLG